MKRFCNFIILATKLVKEYSVVVEDTTAPNMTDVTVATDYSTNKVKVAYTLDEAATVSVAIKDQR